MDGCGCIQADSATAHARHCHWIVSHDALGDARQPGARADRLRLHWHPNPLHGSPSHRGVQQYTFVKKGDYTSENPSIQ